jgi:hypothetical protein
MKSCGIKFSFSPHLNVPGEEPTVPYLQQKKEERVYSCHNHWKFLTSLTRHFIDVTFKSFQSLTKKKKKDQRVHLFQIIGLELRALYVSKVCAVVENFSSRAGHSEADLMIERCKYFHFLSNLLFLGVDNPG